MFKKETLIQTLVGLVIMLSIAATFGIILLIQSKNIIYSYAVKQVEHANVPKPFPVSVDVASKTITENPAVTTYFTDSLAHAENAKSNWWNQVAAVFSSHEWYQNLASPVSRIIVIWPGERKEEVASNIGKILNWNQDERTEFLTLIDSAEPALLEGKYFPGQYLAHKGATPQDIYSIVHQAFLEEIVARYTPEVEAKIPFEEAMIIASLLEREASDFENMREVSGVIWNRIFTDMPLQLDATLQYVTGSDPYQPHWWPKVRSEDKFVKSPYNTYENTGLPPAPISNVSSEAMLAALNPIITDCLFYFHTANGAYHCSATYQEHVAKLRSLYGRGR